MHRRFWRGTAECRRLSRVPTTLATKACHVTERPSVHPLWVVPAAFCASGFINDARPHRSPNVDFVQVFDPVQTSTQLLVPGLVLMVVIEDIAAGEEVVVDYGASYVTIE